jgi:hypothetical protein
VAASVGAGVLLYDDEISLGSDQAFGRRSWGLKSARRGLVGFGFTDFHLSIEWVRACNCVNLCCYWCCIFSVELAFHKLVNECFYRCEPLDRHIHRCCPLR